MTIGLDTYHVGDCRELLGQLEDGSVQTCVTSPPYWGLRDYGVNGQLGLERTPDEYVANMVVVFREVRRALRDDGTLWLNLGDTYASGEVGRKDGGREGRRFGDVQRPRRERRIKLRTGLPKHSLVGIPWRVCFALRDDGWVLRSEVIWDKGAIPENANRPSRKHEHVFMFSKGSYTYDRTAPDPGTVWRIPTEPLREDHFAAMPTALASRCILLGSKAGDVVLDPFGGSGTVARVAEDLGRRWILFDLNPEYAAIAKKRTAQVGLLGRCSL